MNDGTGGAGLQALSTCRPPNSYYSYKRLIFVFDKSEFNGIYGIYAAL